MANHNELKMRRAEKQIKDKEMISKILAMCPACTLAIYDEPYPYAVPLNYGFTWEDKLVIYLHMASEGHKISLLKRNPYVSCNMYSFVDRSHAEKYRGEQQDYRSVTVFGKVEIITGEQPEEFLTGMNAIQKQYGRYIFEDAPVIPNMYVVKLVADAVTAKAMYPVETVEDIEMPESRPVI